MKILISDDDRIIRTQISHILRKAAYEVVESSNGLDTLAQLSQPNAPKLAIIDWMMPGMEGTEVIKKVRNIETDRPPYIIMLSAKSEKAALIAGIDAGAQDYLIKPFNPGELLARVKVGKDMVEMQLRQHRLRAYAQSMKVENDKHLQQLQSELDEKVKKLHHTEQLIHQLQLHVDQLLVERTTIFHQINNTLRLKLTHLQSQIEDVHLTVSKEHPNMDEPINHKLNDIMSRVENLSGSIATISQSLNRF